MKKLTLLVALVVCCGRGDAADFREAVVQKVKAAEAAGKTAIVGEEGWFFFVPDLSALIVGPFWGEDAAKVSKAAKPEHADPLEPILDFKRQLDGAGIELIVVPVPSKAMIYSDKIYSDAKIDDSAQLAPHHARFYELLRKHGVNVLDLTRPFFAASNGENGLLYCKTDTHWSGRACSIASRLIIEQIGDRVQNAKREKYASETRSVEITGDLLPMVPEEKRYSESLPLTFVGTKKNGELLPVEPSRDSPVLLIGDSHVLVFHDPALHAKGAGLPDHLALQLGFPVDLNGVRGSASVATLVNLMRRKDNLAGKKVVIWVMAMREFTESISGWRKVPVIR